MARRAITLTIVPHALFEALQFTLSLQPVGPGQQMAQHEIRNALENAMDARRQRLTISQFQVSPLKWGVRICKPFVRLSRLRSSIATIALL